MAECNPQQRAAWACRMEQTLARIDGRWKLLIVSHLSNAHTYGNGVMRFSELERAIPRASQKMLIQQLRRLEQDGIVHRTAFPEVPPRVEYRLTDYGFTLLPVLREIDHWGTLQPPQPSQPATQVGHSR